MGAVFWALLAGLLLLAAPGGRRHPRLIGLAALLYGLDVLATLLPSWYPPLFLGLQHNWTGKLLSVALSLLVVYGFRVLSPAEAGLTRPAPGSLRRVLPAVLGLAAVQFTGAFWFRHTHADPAPGWEANLYELTMPGLAEELFARGVLLGLLMRVFPRTLPFFGTRTSWGGVAGLVLFVLGHVLLFGHSPWQVLPRVLHSLETPLAVTFFGTLFLWVRERTGSSLAAAAVHNLMNTCLYLGLTLP